MKLFLLFAALAEKSTKYQQQAVICADSCHLVMWCKTYFAIVQKIHLTLGWESPLVRHTGPRYKDGCDAKMLIRFSRSSNQTVVWFWSLVRCQDGMVLIPREIPTALYNWVSIGDDTPVPDIKMVGMQKHWYVSQCSQIKLLYGLIPREMTTTFYD